MTTQRTLTMSEFDGYSSQVIEFDGDDAGYFEWLHAHPDGYVVNV